MTLQLEVSIAIETTVDHLLKCFFFGLNFLTDKKFASTKYRRNHCKIDSTISS